MLVQPCNVSRKDDLRAIVDATVKRWGRIDIAVANAASNPYYGPLADIPDEAFDKIFGNNVKSVLWLAAWSGNARALAFYARQGYSDIGAAEHVFEGRRFENRRFAKPLGVSAPAAFG